MNPIVMLGLSMLLLAELATAKTNFIVIQPDDHYFFEEWGPPGHFDGGNSLEQFPPNSNGLPNINRIRQDGIEMKSAYAASTMCGTSRYSTITGRYPSRSAYGRERDQGSFKRDVRIPSTKLEDVTVVSDSKDCSENNIAALLQQNGYKTGVVGKWHLFSDDGGTYSYDRIRSDVRDCGFDFAEAIYKENMNGNWYGDATHNMEHVAAEAFSFIEESVQEEKPFFLYFNPTIPHSSADVTDALEYADCRNTVGGRLSDNPSIRYGMTADFGGDCRAYRQSVLDRGGKNDDRLAGAVWLDDSIGSLFQLLKNLDVLENTFILFQLDHGEAGKGSLFETGSRIVQFVHHPNLFSGGRTFQGLVSTIDIAATIADIAGVPETDRYSMDGKSWKSEVVRFNDGWSFGNDRCLFVEESYDRSVRCGCYKYIHIENVNDRTSFSTMGLARWNGISMSNDNYYNLCDDDTGLYISAPDVSPETRSADLSELVKAELKAKVDCHLDRTRPSRTPDYDHSCDMPIDSLGVPIVTAPPTSPPTSPPTGSPTRFPTLSPTKSQSPTLQPTQEPTEIPTISAQPTSPPTSPPTGSPTRFPTFSPTKSASPTSQPSQEPTEMPTTSAQPSSPPTKSQSPTSQLSQEPTEIPTIQPPPISKASVKTLTNSSEFMDFFESINFDDDSLINNLENATVTLTPQPPQEPPKKVPTIELLPTSGQSRLVISITTKGLTCLWIIWVFCQ